MLRSTFWTLAGLILFPAAVRTLPYALGACGVDIRPGWGIYPWNFSPLTAIFLLGSARLIMPPNGRWLPLVFPVATLILSDLGIWAATGNRSMAFHSGTLLIYACFVLTATQGLLLRGRHWMWSLPVGVLAETLFFLITNFAVWMASDSTRFAPDGAGLLHCYALGLPFFKMSLESTAIYVPLLFGGLAFVESQASMSRSEHTAIPVPLPLKHRGD